MNELVIDGVIGSPTVYATLRRQSDDMAWNNMGSAWETSENDHQPNYAVAMTETPAGSQYYVANMPTGITDVVIVTYWKRLGGTPATTDLVLGGEVLNGLPTGVDGDLITLDEYQTYIGNSDSTKAGKRSFMITMVSEGVRKHTQTGILAEDRDEIYDGSGFNYLHLKTKPINSVTSVTIGVYDQIPITITETNPPTCFFWNDGGTLKFRPTSITQSYFPPTQIEVRYNAGFSQTPNDLKGAVCLAVQAMEQLSNGELFATQKRVRDVSITYGQVLKGDFSDPIFAPIQTVLNYYADTFLE